MPNRDFKGFPQGRFCPEIRVGSLTLSATAGPEEWSSIRDGQPERRTKSGLQAVRANSPPITAAVGVMSAIQHDNFRDNQNDPRHKRFGADQILTVRHCSTHGAGRHTVHHNYRGARFAANIAQSVQPGPNLKRHDRLFAQGTQRFQPVIPLDQNIPILGRPHRDRRRLTIFKHIFGQCRNLIWLQRLLPFTGNLDICDGQGEFDWHSMTVHMFSPKHQPRFRANLRESRLTVAHPRLKAMVQNYGWVAFGAGPR